MREHARAGEAPDDHDAREPLYRRIDPESDQGDRPGDDARDDSHQALERHVDEAGPGQDLRSAREPEELRRPVGDGGGFHPPIVAPESPAKHPWPENNRMGQSPHGPACRREARGAARPRLSAGGRRTAPRPPARLPRRRPGDLGAPAGRALGRVPGDGLGRPGLGLVGRSTARVPARRLRRPARGAHRRPGTRAPARGGHLIGWRAGDRAVPPPPRLTAHARAGLGLRGLGRLASARRDGAAPAPGARARRPPAGRFHQGGRAHPVRRVDAGGDRGCFRGERCGVPSRRAYARWRARWPRRTCATSSRRSRFQHS